MSERDQNDKGPSAPRRPLSEAQGSTGSSSDGSASRPPSASQTTMAIPVVNDRPAPPQAPQESPDPEAAQQAPSAGGPKVRAAETTGAAATRPSSGATAVGESESVTPVSEEPRLGSESARLSAGSARTQKPSAGTRKARLQLTRVDPWSVMKLAFALSIALAIVTVVAVAIVWSVLEAAGVWDAINSSVGTVLSEDNSTEFDVTDYVGTSRVLGLTAIVSAANVVLLTAIATLAAFLYNLAASLLGGLEVTLAEDRN